VNRPDGSDQSSDVGPVAGEFQAEVGSFVIHQATGMVMVQAGVTPTEALHLLDVFANEAGMSVNAVARDVVNGVHSFAADREDRNAG
jgi:hypothetical protein